MTMTNDRPDLSSGGALVIGKAILVNVNRNKYPVVRPSWALKPGVVSHTHTLNVYATNVVSHTHTLNVYAANVVSWKMSSLGEEGMFMLRM
jgi:hypothetical protein